MANSVSRSLILAEAARRGWPTQEIGQAYLLKIIHPDGRWEMVRGTCPMRSSAIGVLIAKYKHLTADFVQTYGYSTPPYILAENEQDVLDFLQQQGKIVIKPADGQRTEGVTVGITDAAAVPAAYKHALANSPDGKVLAQKHLGGNLYRILVLDGKLVAASWRTAAAVTGDGRQTVRELIEQANQDPRRGKGVDTPLKVISIADAADYLGQEKLDSVPEGNQRITVSPIDSVSAGGEAVTVTDQVHPQWRQVCEQLATEAGLFICGYDVMCDDIAQPLTDNYLPLLEMNAGPGMKLHEYPTGGGEPVHLAPLLLDALFPEA